MYITTYKCRIQNKSQKTERCLLQIYSLHSKGEVEGTRLEAKDTKKNSRPRPRITLPRRDPLEAKDKNARGQRQGPRTQAQVLSKKKKGLQKIFQAMSNKKKVFKKNFKAISSKKRLPKFFFRRSTKFQQFKKSAVFDARTGQFLRTWGLEVKDFKMCPRGRPRGQERPRERHLWYIGNLKHCCCCTSPLFIKPEQNDSKVKWSKKLFAAAEAPKITAKTMQDCRFAVTDHPLLFCGICGCGIERKFAMPSIADFMTADLVEIVTVYLGDIGSYGPFLSVYEFADQDKSFLPCFF